MPNLPAAYKAVPYEKKRTVWDKVGYEPHPAQEEMHRCDSRFLLAVCGRRFGKSKFAAREVLPELFIPRRRWWIVGPTYELAEREFEVLYDDFMGMPADFRNKCTIRYNLKAGDMMIKTPMGSEVICKSAERPRGLLGKGLDGVIMSEPAEHDIYTWDRFIRPALADRRGRAIFPGTPKGFDPLVYPFYVRGKDPQFPDWSSFRHPSWANSAVFSGPDDPEILEAKNSMPHSLFMQEICAEFVTFEGRIYEEFSEDIHVRDLEYQPAWRNFISWDFGYTAPTVALDIQVDPSDNVYVWREYYVKYQPAFIHAKNIRERQNPDGYKIDCMFGDPAAAGDIATLSTLLGAVWARKVPWEQGIDAVKRHLQVGQDGQPKLFIDRSCVNLIRGMNQLRVESEKHDRTPKEGQHKYDDHAPDALRYFFNEYFILGAGSSLTDAYRFEDRSTASGTFFQYDPANSFKLGRSGWQ